MKTGVVLLYGLFSPQNKGYKAYLDFVAKEINKRKLNEVILCGGYTDPKQPNSSEASTAKEYLLTVNKSFNNYQLEDRSITTNENLKFASKKINTQDNIIVYCDLCRKAKVIWIILHYLANLTPKEIYKSLLSFTNHKDIYKDFEYRNLKVVGFDFPNKSKEELMGQTYASLFDTFALYDEEMENMELKQRRKNFGL